MERALSKENQLTLCYIDIDGLKYVNDKYGHLEGDNYIAMIVSAIKRQIRMNDVFARIGGDEFCIVLPGDRCDLLTVKMEKVMESLQNESKQEYPISFSYGVAKSEEVGEKSERSLNALIECADRKMYAYKKRNKEKYIRV